MSSFIAKPNQIAKTDNSSYLSLNSSEEEIEEFVKSIDNHSLYFVATTFQSSWKTAINKVLKETAKNHKNVHIID